MQGCRCSKSARFPTKRSSDICNYCQEGVLDLFGHSNTVIFGVCSHCHASMSHLIPAKRSLDHFRSHHMAFLVISGIRHEAMGPCFTCLSQSVIRPLQLFAYGRFLATSGMRPICLVSPSSHYNAAIGHLFLAKRSSDHLNYRHTSHLARYRASGMRRCNQFSPQWDCALVGLISGCFQYSAGSLVIRKDVS